MISLSSEVVLISKDKYALKLLMCHLDKPEQVFHAGQIIGKGDKEEYQLMLASMVTELLNKVFANEETKAE